MLTLRKHGYSLRDLAILYKALTRSVGELACSTDGCGNCKNAMVCGDLNSCAHYVYRCIQEEEVEYSEMLE